MGAWRGSFRSYLLLGTAVRIAPILSINCFYIARWLLAVWWQVRGGSRFFVELDAVRSPACATSVDHAECGRPCRRRSCYLIGTRAILTTPAWAVVAVFSFDAASGCDCPAAPHAHSEECSAGPATTRRRVSASATRLARHEATEAVHRRDRCAGCDAVPGARSRGR